MEQEPHNIPDDLNLQELAPEFNSIMRCYEASIFAHRLYRDYIQGSESPTEELEIWVHDTSHPNNSYAHEVHELYRDDEIYRVPEEHEACTQAYYLYIDSQGQIREYRCLLDARNMILAERSVDFEQLEVERIDALNGRELSRRFRQDPRLFKDLVDELMDDMPREQTEAEREQAKRNHPSSHNKPDKN